jgi:hypothetical protein
MLRQWLFVAAVIVLQVAARHVSGSEQRTALCRAAGASLLSQIWPQGLQEARAAAAAATGKQSASTFVCAVLYVRQAQQWAQGGVRREGDDNTS